MSNLIKNEQGCCEWVSCNESPVQKIEAECNTDCCDRVANPCGYTHPAGSGTIAGCKSTTPPHFGVVMQETKGNCTNFAYYTSGNTTDYENTCGTLDKLTYKEKLADCCPVVGEYSTESCDCFENAASSSDEDNTIVNIVDADGVKKMVFEDASTLDMPEYTDLTGNPVT